MNLYMFYVGGNAGKSNIEVHDIQFVAARKPNDAGLHCVKHGLVIVIKFI